jgi:aconitate hydratase
VLSGNRNFEGRIQQDVRANYLASPPLVVAYALTGTLNVDLTTEAVGHSPDGKPVFLRDLWPTGQESRRRCWHHSPPRCSGRSTARCSKGAERWRALPVPTGDRFAWESDSTYIRRPPFSREPHARAGCAPRTSWARARSRCSATASRPITFRRRDPSRPTARPASTSVSQGVTPKDFNSYGARRGNHEVMMRGTFANVRLRNQLAPGTEGGWTSHLPGGEVMPIFDASSAIAPAACPLVVLAGKEYGSGSSRDWAAKGTMLLGCQSGHRRSFERIHRSNLVNMGVLPLEFVSGMSVASLGITGREVFDFGGSGAKLTPRSTLTVAPRENGTTFSFPARVRIDTPEELIAFATGHPRRAPASCSTAARAN